MNRCFLQPKIVSLIYSPDDRRQIDYFLGLTKYFQNILFLEDNKKELIVDTEDIIFFKNSFLPTFFSMNKEGHRFVFIEPIFYDLRIDVDLSSIENIMVIFNMNNVDKKFRISDNIDWLSYHGLNFRYNCVQILDKQVNLDKIANFLF